MAAQHSRFHRAATAQHSRFYRAATAQLQISSLQSFPRWSFSPTSTPLPTFSNQKREKRRERDAPMHRAGADSPSQLPSSSTTAFGICWRSDAATAQSAAHPPTLVSINNLGLLLEGQRDRTGAEGSCGGAGSVPSLQICRWPSFFSAQKLSAPTMHRPHKSFAL